MQLVKRLELSVQSRDLSVHSHKDIRARALTPLSFWWSGFMIALMCPSAYYKNGERSNIRHLHISLAKKRKIKLAEISWGLRANQSIQTNPQISVMAKGYSYIFQSILPSRIQSILPPVPQLHQPAYMTILANWYGEQSILRRIL